MTQHLDGQPESVHERILHYGAEATNDEELLGLLLHSSSTAAYLMQRYGTMRAMEKIEVTELCKLPGIGMRRAMVLKALLVLSRRLRTVPLERGHKFTCSQQVWEAFGPRLGALRQETFWVILLDTRNRILREMKVAEGSLVNCPVHPREVFSAAVRECAANIILLHNHPSGDPEPSIEDRDLTERLVSAGALLGVRVLDHLVVCEGDYVSFADKGWM